MSESYFYFYKGNRTVNYLSLDIEGAELQVSRYLTNVYHIVLYLQLCDNTHTQSNLSNCMLQVLRTIPFEKVDIEVITGRRS
jgi:hypothetical protein